MLRLAITIASEKAPPAAFVVWRGFESSLHKARALGFDGVELALQDAGEIDLGGMKRQLKDAGLVCPCISTGQVFANLNLHFATTDPARKTQLLDVFRGLIDVAAELGAMVNVGRCRGFIEPGQSRAQTQERFIATARELCLYARSCGVTLVLEPVNRYEINFINSVAEAVALLDTAGLTDMALMPDLFHMNIEDRDIASELRQHCHRVRYLHMADSNRLAPGQGHIDFTAVFLALKQCGYSGWASVEILPQPDPDTAARQAIEYLRPLIKAYNDGCA